MVDRFDAERAKGIQDSVGVSVKLLAYTRGEMPEPFIPEIEAFRLRKRERVAVTKLGNLFLDILADPKVVDLRAKYGIANPELPLVSWNIPLGSKEGAWDWPSVDLIAPEPSDRKSYFLRAGESVDAMRSDMRKGQIETALQQILPGDWSFDIKFNWVSARKAFTIQDFVDNREFFLEFLRATGSTINNLWEKALTDIRKATMTEEQKREAKLFIEACKEASEFFVSHLASADTNKHSKSSRSRHKAS